MKTEKKSANHEKSVDFMTSLQQIKPAASGDDKAFSRKVLSRIKKISHDFTPGKDYSCLFAGNNDTGKTMAAQVIAKELGLTAYRIDLSMIVSKYIGETEKNLELLFARAEDHGWILFFDEADALFGKRSEVKDSHDRYANIEASYLLQRIEEYNGIVILSTNKKDVIDKEFLRHFRSVVDFSVT